MVCNTRLYIKGVFPSLNDLVLQFELVQGTQSKSLYHQSQFLVVMKEKQVFLLEVVFGRHEHGFQRDQPNNL